MHVKEGGEGSLLLGEQDGGVTSSMTSSYDEDLIPLDNESACKVGHVKSVKLCPSCEWH